MSVNEVEGVHRWPFWLQDCGPPTFFKSAMDVMDVDEAPEEGDDGAGGPHYIPESLSELADRVREVEAMRMGDKGERSGSPTEMYSPHSTEAVEEKPMEVSPLLQLKRMVDSAQATSSSTATTTKEEEVSTDEFGMIKNEQQKLRKFIPEHLKMPWERGFAGVVLNQGGNILPLECLRESTRSAKAMDVEVDQPGKPPEPEKLMPSFVIKESGKLPWDRAQTEERDKVLTGWMVVIAEAGRHSRARNMIDTDGEGVLDDIFAKKKNGTLQVRLSALMLYIRWARAKGYSPFPLDEDQCYQYVDQLRRDGAPATRASSFRSALAFCKGTIDLDGVDDILRSTRIAGSAHQSFLTKRVLRQRDALTVHQVSILERVVCEQAFPLQDRIFAGHCLVCIYGRLRFGDSQGIQQEPQVDGGFLEGGTSTHKTDSISGRACRILPVVAPEVGVTGAAWAVALLKLRDISGLRGLPGRPFLPTPVLGGGWSSAKLSTSEASVWLCEVLKKYSLAPGQLSNVGAHSLKATTLSWMAKYMVPEKVRRLMGYHVKPKDKSVLVYSRDALATGLEALTRIIQDIQQGKFRPDAPRNRRFVGTDPAPAETQEDQQQDEQDEVLLPDPEDKVQMHEVPTPEKTSYRLVSIGRPPVRARSQWTRPKRVSTRGTWRQWCTAGLARQRSPTWTCTGMA